MDHRTMRWVAILAFLTSALPLAAQAIEENVALAYDVCSSDDASCSLSLIQTRVQSRHTSQPLPEISSLLSPASDVVSAVQKQTESLEQRIAKAQADNAAKIETQKRDYEDQLLQQEKAIKDLAKNNSDLTQEIKENREINHDLKRQTDEANDSILKMRQLFQDLQLKLSIAGKLSNESVSNAKLVRKGNEFAEGMKSFNEDAKEQEEAKVMEPVQLLQMSSVASAKGKHTLFLSHDGSSDTETLPVLRGLTGGMSALQAQMAAGEKKLKDMFDVEYNKGSEHRAELEDENKKLKTQYDAIMKRQSKLIAQNERLEKSLSYLRSRQEGIKLYVQNLLNDVA